MTCKLSRATAGKKIKLCLLFKRKEVLEDDAQYHNVMF